MDGFWGSFHFTLPGSLAPLFWLVLKLGCSKVILDQSLPWVAQGVAYSDYGESDSPALVFVNSPVKRKPKGSQSSYALRHLRASPGFSLSRSRRRGRCKPSTPPMTGERRDLIDRAGRELLGFRLLGHPFRAQLKPKGKPYSSFCRSEHVFPSPPVGFKENLLHCTKQPRGLLSNWRLGNKRFVDERPAVV